MAAHAPRTQPVKYRQANKNMQRHVWLTPLQAWPCHAAQTVTCIRPAAPCSYPGGAPDSVLTALHQAGCVTGSKRHLSTDRLQDCRSSARLPLQSLPPSLTQHSTRVSAALSFVLPGVQGKHILGSTWIAKFWAARRRKGRGNTDARAVWAPRIAATAFLPKSCARAAASAWHHAHALSGDTLLALKTTPAAYWRTACPHPADAAWGEDGAQRTMELSHRVQQRPAAEAVWPMWSWGQTWGVGCLQGHGWGQSHLVSGLHACTTSTKESLVQPCNTCLAQLSKADFFFSMQQIRARVRAPPRPPGA